MLIKQLNISNFRNIGSAQLNTEKQVNVFFGENGSGKTSVLEAIYYLSRAKSFRTSKRKELVKMEQASLTVSSKIEQEQQQHFAGVSLDEKGNNRLRLDGEDVLRLSEWSALTPTQLITPESFDVFWSSPKARRSFFDFGLFHVEQSFPKLWSDFIKLSKQVGAILKSTKPISDSETLYWYKYLVSLASKVDELRAEFLNTNFAIALDELKDALGEKDNHVLLSDLEIRYKSKPIDDSDDNALLEQINKDKKYKQIGFGPNRSDFVFMKNGLDLSKILSRGQAKMLFYLLEVAMVKVINTTSNKNMVLLVDDLPSEVDELTRQTMLEMLLYSNAQIFVTGIENKIAMEFIKYTDSVNVFHVEHGTVRKANMEQLCP